MSGATGGIGELSYSSFYLPTLALGFLATSNQNPIFEYIPTLSYMITIHPRGLFYILTGISFLSALQIHGLSRAVFGPAGPEDHPKSTESATRAFLCIILGTKLEDIPPVPFRSIGNSIFKPSINPDHRTVKDRVDTTFLRLQNTILGLIEISEKITIKNSIRILYYLPGVLHNRMSQATLILLVAYVYLGGNGYIPVVLIFALIVLNFRSWFWWGIPTVYNTDELTDIHTPEYDKKIRKREDVKDD